MFPSSIAVGTVALCLAHLRGLASAFGLVSLPADPLAVLLAITPAHLVAREAAERRFLRPIGLRVPEGRRNG